MGGENGSDGVMRRSGVLRESGLEPLTHHSIIPFFHFLFL
jgi:hypothetical protein